MWAHFINAAIGIWMMAAPAVLAYGAPAATNDRIIGPLVATFSIIAWWSVTRGVRWVNLPLGIWLVAAPWILGYDTTLIIMHSTAVGIVVAALSLVKGRIRKDYAGGWRMLLGKS